MGIRAFPLCLEALETWARILLKETAPTGIEKRERAYQLLHLILNHPASTQYRRDKVTKLLAELEAQGVTSRRQSKVQDLSGVVAEVLAELER
jgi:hypothetical protein